MSKSALASLTAQYTDSENENEIDSDTEVSPKTEGSVESVATVNQGGNTPPEKEISVNKVKSALRLVSYNDDLVVSDEENVSPNRENINMEISEEDNSVESIEKQPVVKKNRFTEYGFSLPPEPKGKCPQELQDKIVNMYDKIKNGMDMNKLIQERKEFRNPSIYEKLIQFCDIDELGTNYPPEIYDPLQWGKESFFEELARVQKVEMDKREKDRKDNVKQEMVIAAAKKAEEEAKKRKSKWDQPAPNASINPPKPSVSFPTITTAQTLTQPSKPTTIITTGIAAVTSTTTAITSGVPAPLTTNVTGTKGTVISAFGSLPKKPKI